MTMHIESRTLCRTETVRVEDVCCRSPLRSRQAEEEAARPAFAVVRSGVFVKHSGSRELVANANHVLFFPPARPYAISHPVAGGDDCTAVSFPVSTLREVLRDVAPGRADDRAERLLPIEQTLNDPATALVLQQLRFGLLRGHAEPIAIDEIALALLRRLVSAAETGDVRPDTARRYATRRHHRALVSRTRLFLSTMFRQPLDLSTIGCAVGASPFHLSRVFRYETGWSIHRYVLRLRLRAALDAIAEGCDDLTRLALDLGFASHSHLTTSFRSEFGVPPSQARSCLGHARLLELSRNLEA